VNINNINYIISKQVISNKNEVSANYFNNYFVNKKKKIIKNEKIEENAFPRIFDEYINESGTATK